MGMIAFLSLTSIFSCSTPKAPPDRDGTEVLQSLQKILLEAKTLRIRLTYTSTWPKESSVGKTSTGTATVILKGQQQYYFQMSSNGQDGQKALTYISDGSGTQYHYKGQWHDWPGAKNTLSSNLRLAFARAGLFGPAWGSDTILWWSFALSDAPALFESHLTVERPRVNVDGSEHPTLFYNLPQYFGSSVMPPSVSELTTAQATRLVMRDGKTSHVRNPTRVSLVYDPKTMTPIQISYDFEIWSWNKRRWIVTEGHFEEHYEEFLINPDVPDSRFTSKPPPPPR